MKKYIKVIVSAVLGFGGSIAAERGLLDFLPDTLLVIVLGATIIVSLYLAFTSKLIANLSRSHGMVGLVVFVSVGAALGGATGWIAWRALETKQGHKEKAPPQGRPELRGEMLQINQHPIPKQFERKGSAILAVFQIKNLGEPSIVERYRLTALASGTRTEGKLQKIPNKMTLTGPAGSQIYFGKDAMYSKTSTSPIGRSSQVVGTLWAWFEGVPSDSLDGDSVEISFSDAYGTVYTTPQYEVAAGKPMYYPGLSTEP